MLRLKKFHCFEGFSQYSVLIEGSESCSTLYWSLSFNIQQTVINSKEMNITDRIGELTRYLQICVTSLKLFCVVVQATRLLCVVLRAPQDNVYRITDRASKGGSCLAVWLRLRNLFNHTLLPTVRWLKWLCSVHKRNA